MATPRSAATPDTTDIAEQEAPTPQGDLRTRAARGTVVNAGYMVGLHTLGVLKGFVVAAFLTRSEFGVWGILVITIGTLTWLKDVGVGDKYVQQTDQDQEAAFQKAFTLEAIVNGAFLGVVLLTLPLFALAYGQWQIVAPGLAIAAGIPAMALRTPTWVYYREMRFLKQRTLEAIDPVVSFVVTIGLAIAGLGYWSLVFGWLAGMWAAALVAVIASPFALRFRFERRTAREYFSFSWPLLVATSSGVLVPQLGMLVGEAELGLAGAGALALAGSIAAYTDKVDQVVTWTLYPAICRVRDRADLLFEAFAKSNRLALMWGVPFGVGVALFAADLVHYGIGERWEPAIGLIAAFGLIAAANHIGFNWTAFFRALDWTVPMAVVAPIVVATFCAVALPLLVAYGLDGFALGMGAMTAVALALRAYYLRRIFPGFRMWVHILRGIAPTIPAAGATLLLRAVGPERSAAVAIAELALYLAVTVIATLLLERPLLREVVGYLRGRRPQPIGA